MNFIKSILPVLSFMVVVFGISMVSNNTVEAKIDRPNCFYSTIDNDCHDVSYNCICFDIEPEQL